MSLGVNGWGIGPAVSFESPIGATKSSKSRLGEPRSLGSGNSSATMFGALSDSPPVVLVASLPDVVVESVLVSLPDVVPLLSELLEEGQSTVGAGPLGVVVFPGLVLPGLVPPELSSPPLCDEV
jgi:hypothetical protein